ncbi:hypothetical protein HMPREF1568_1238 [Providencia alcalifaciens PAL-3]|nr:hypothetical protein HMPREF1568_1238 [Providencia alcalifaciens PAL-3]EUD00330.1 hypothetical protein HMPREF1566_2055 [Providencia alcalifaciens PAL-1]
MGLLTNKTVIRFDNGEYKTPAIKKAAPERCFQKHDLLFSDYQLTDN